MLRSAYLRAVKNSLRRSQKVLTNLILICIKEKSHQHSNVTSCGDGMHYRRVANACEYARRCRAARGAAGDSARGVWRREPVVLRPAAIVVRQVFQLRALELGEGFGAGHRRPEALALQPGENFVVQRVELRVPVDA